MQGVVTCLHSVLLVKVPSVSCPSVVMNCCLEMEDNSISPPLVIGPGPPLQASVDVDFVFLMGTSSYELRNATELLLSSELICAVCRCIAIKPGLCAVVVNALAYIRLAQTSGTPQGRPTVWLLSHLKASKHIANPTCVSKHSKAENEASRKGW